MPDDQKTWGYDAKTGEPKLFPTAKLPKGYVDSPAKVKK